MTLDEIQTKLNILMPKFATFNFWHQHNLDEVFDLMNSKLEKELENKNLNLNFSFLNIPEYLTLSSYMAGFFGEKTLQVLTNFAYNYNSLPWASKTGLMRMCDAHLIYLNKMKFYNLFIKSTQIEDKINKNYRSGEMTLSFSYDHIYVIEENTNYEIYE